MAVQIWSNMSILTGGYEIGCKAKNVMLDAECAVLDTTALCVSDTYQTFIGGRKKVTFSMEGMADFATGQVDPNISTAGTLGVSGVPFSILPAGITDGSKAYTTSSLSLQYTPISGGGDLSMFKLAGSGVGAPLIKGTLLHPTATARTSSSTGTGRQLGAITATQRMYGALHVLSAGTGSMTVKIQSDDNASFTSATDRITFTAATAATYQWSSVAGAVTDDYWRVSYTISGGAPSFVFAVIAGIGAL